MDNPIRYEDLFDAELGNKLTALGGAVTAMLTEIHQSQKDIKEAAKELKDALGLTTSANNDGANATRNHAERTQQLFESFQRLKKEEQEVVQLNEQLLTTQKEQKKADDLQLKMAREKETSYNRISAQYSATMAALRAMTAEEVKSTAQGQRLVAQARELRDEMKNFQAAVGNMSLNVGNYTEGVSKAMNGLNIATTQVLREMPTLANSFSQFFIAISNNVPIFVDNLKRVKEETGSWMTAMKGVVASIFSWQTALLVLLTVLPKIAKAIHDKKKAQEEDNKETEKAIKLAQLYADAMEYTAKEVEKNEEKLKTLYYVSQDVNRSIDDRIKAGEEIKAMYEEEFANFSAEEIALGNAKAAYDQLTESLMQQATARAYLQKITDLSVQKIEQQIKADAVKIERDRAKEERDRLQTLHDMNKEYDDMGNEVSEYSGQLGKAKKNFEKLDIEFQKADMPIQELGNTIKKLRDEIPVEGLVTEIVSGRGRKGKTAKEKTYDVENYIFEAWQSVINMMDKGMERELAQTDLNYKKEQAKREEQMATLLEITQVGNEREQEEARKQITILSQLVSQEGIEYAKARADIVDKYFQMTLKDEQDTLKEIDKLIEQGYKDQLDELDAYYNAESAKAYAAYDNRQNRTRAMLQVEIQYLKDRKALLMQQGQLTLAMDKEIEASIEALEQRIDDLTPRGFLDWLSQAVDENWSQRFISNVEKAFDTFGKYAEQWMDYRIKMADVAIEQAEREAQEAKTWLDYEAEARANGYANNVEMARKEYEERLALEQAAIREKQRLQRAQDRIDTATQTSSLITAAANIWKTRSGIPGIGTALAVAAITAMFASFAAAKIQARKLSQVTYGDGMSEYLDYGGSHASGHDIDFGTMKDGTRRRVERGEMIGVINKRNVQKYGVGEISNIIASLNKGTFEEKYGLAFAGMALNASTADLTRLESGVDALVQQGERRTVLTANGRIEYYKNTKRIIRS